MSGDLNARAVPESRFRAFVSYSHADKAAAQRLHRKLESYRLPKHLRDAASNTASDGRVGAIFRDREDLPAAQDLTESVKEALSVSEALVVLCSPAAKASPWVAREIELFRELHPDRPILAALLRGEPDDAFPEPLRQGREPLAADLRKEGDGPRLGFLKVVAGIAGVPLDALINRDAQRRVRRVTAITVAALAAMVVMALMTTFAIQSRNEAQYQRAEAEGLIGFMLTDLRSELRGVGRSDIMAAVNQRALDYFTKQGDISDLSDDNLQSWASGLHAYGEDQDVTGNLATARLSFEQAHRTTEELLKRTPNNADRVFAHAQSEYWAGYAAWQKADLENTEKFWQGYLKQAQNLAVLEPNTTRSLMELGYANGNMCELFMKRSQAPKAEQSCIDAIDYMAAAFSKTPSDRNIQSSLANRQGWLADVFYRQNKYQQAIAHRKIETRLISELRKDAPLDAELRLRSLYPLLGHAEADLGQENVRPALSLIQEALAEIAALERIDDRNRHVTALKIKALIISARAKKAASEMSWSADLSAAKALFRKTVSEDGAGPVARMQVFITNFEKEIEGG